jgi:hypothetical protein
MQADHKTSNPVADSLMLLVILAVIAGWGWVFYRNNFNTDRRAKWLTTGAVLLFVASIIYAWAHGIWLAEP